MKQIFVIFLVVTLVACGEKVKDTTDDLKETIKRQDKALKDLNDSLEFASKLRIEKMKQDGSRKR